MPSKSGLALLQCPFGRMGYLPITDTTTTKIINRHYKRTAKLEHGLLSSI